MAHNVIINPKTVARLTPKQRLTILINNSAIIFGKNTCIRLLQAYKNKNFKYIGNQPIRIKLPKNVQIIRPIYVNQCLDNFFNSLIALEIYFNNFNRELDSMIHYLEEVA